MYKVYLDTLSLLREKNQFFIRSAEMHILIHTLRQLKLPPVCSFKSYMEIRYYCTSVSLRSVIVRKARNY